MPRYEYLITFQGASFIVEAKSEADALQQAIDWFQGRVEIEAAGYVAMEDSLNGER